MARPPLAIDAPDYHDKLELFALEVARQLADRLLEAGLSREQAEDVTGSFLFDFAMLFDEGGSYKVGGKLKPRIGFATELRELIVPTGGTYLHELAFDIAERAFDEAGRGVARD